MVKDGKELNGQNKDQNSKPGNDSDVIGDSQNQDPKTASSLKQENKPASQEEGKMQESEKEKSNDGIIDINSETFLADQLDQIAEIGKKQEEERKLSAHLKARELLFGEIAKMFEGKEHEARDIKHEKNADPVTATIKISKDFAGNLESIDIINAAKDIASEQTEKSSSFKIGINDVNGPGNSFVLTISKKEGK